MFRRIRNLLLLLLISAGAFAQPPHRPGSADLYADIQQLQVLGSALYIAAHPDDENTRLISWLANERKIHVAYLSLTRGDGGQNLIGPEIRELLGVIRTQELLAARRIDGGNQLFTRANDFGYSKHPDETLEIWNRNEVLSDVVWGIRKWRPDIIINRFDHESAGRTHGHHTASAVLSVEAFDLADDPKAYPGQLRYLEPWQPKRLFFNTSWWFYGSREKFAEADKSDMIVVDAGVYYPLIGKSNTEIAAESRSQHACQGMGRISDRGSQLEYLQFLKGDRPVNNTDPFAGIDISWNRVEGGTPIGRKLEQVQKDFNFNRPWESVPDLLEVYDMIRALPDGYWKQVKTEEVLEVIQGCLGLFAEVTADEYAASPGQKVELELEIIQQAQGNSTLRSVEFLPMGVDTVLNTQLPFNEGLAMNRIITLPETLDFTNPYWLNEPGTLGMYSVRDQRLRGLPESPRELRVAWNLEIDGRDIRLETPVVYKKGDPAKGEVYRPFEVTSPVFVNFSEQVFVYADQSPKNIRVTVKAGQDSIAGNLKLDVPAGWKAEPQNAAVELGLKGSEQTVDFSLYPPERQATGSIRPVFTFNEKTYSKGITEIAYDHIPTQTIIRDETAKVVKVDLEKAGRRIGYIMGAGDEIPASLEQVGYDVRILDEKEISLENLRNLDAVILGVRAFNTVDRLKFTQPELMEYVKEGGNLIVQYNTSFRMVTEDIAPYPLELSRSRVAVEEAPIRILEPDHPVLNTPNKITQDDFQDWVQERGLYFPGEWDREHFDAILSSNDPGEDPLDGGLLVAPYGKGNYIYTSYSWFRQLPAGVPGAYRIFTNLISLGREEKP